VNQSYLGFPAIPSVVASGWCVFGTLLLSSFPFLTAHAADEPFAVQVIESLGRTVTAELADLDGDGRQDLLQAILFDMPPDERRVLRVHLQQADGAIPAVADLEIDIPELAAAYDVADVDGRPGAELLLLRPRGISLVSVVRGEDGALGTDIRLAPIPEDLTIAAASDERGLDRMELALFGLGDEPWLLAPGIGETFFLSARGELRARIHSGARANYFVQPPGLMLSESDIQLFLDAPRISVGDINGDGRPDLLASARHQLLLFYRNEDGSFPREPTSRITLGRITIEDHIRGSGAVRTEARDIDRDGLADLIVSEALGGVMDANSNTYIHFNHGSGWDLENPDYAFESPKALGADQLMDVDGDGKLELLRVGIPISILELAEIVLTEALDAYIRVYPLDRHATAKPIRPEPWFDVKFGIPLDFKTSRPAGFVPTVEHDLNGDGFRDYLTSAKGDALEIHLGSRETGFRKRTARQKLDTEGQAHAGDLNGDGLTDLVLFNTRRLDQDVKILTNRGILPGTNPSVRAAEAR
jgi:hypothetical protein